MNERALCVCVRVESGEEWRRVMGLGVTPLAGLGEPPDTRSVENLGRKGVEVVGAKEKSGV